MRTQTQTKVAIQSNILNGIIGLVLMEMFQVLHDQYNAPAWIYDGKLHFKIFELQKHRYLWQEREQYFH